MIPNFFYHPRMLAYDFGPQHPLKPERLRRAVELLERMDGSVEVGTCGRGDRSESGTSTFPHLQTSTLSLDPGPGRREDALRVHSEEYLSAIGAIDSGLEVPQGFAERFGFGPGDNPPFPGMLEASLRYLAGSVKAAEAVCDGARVAFNLSGGLHHAHRDKASGFCILSDPAVAIDVLLEGRRSPTLSGQAKVEGRGSDELRMTSDEFPEKSKIQNPKSFSRVAYVDIDVHHGDGVQWIWYDDPRVLTCSIHEDPRYLFPGTGTVEEVGPCYTNLNVPLEPFTTGDVWLWAFENAVLPALEAFEPQAIVLQMGTDAHFNDPLARLQVSAQEWLQAVKRVKALGVPIVAVGGGGYNLTTVPRMWAAAVLTLANVPFEDEIPSDLAEEWGMPRFFDPHLPGPKGTGRGHAERMVEWLRENLIPKVPRPG